MIRISEMEDKDIINIADGRYLGEIADIEIDIRTGCIRALIMPNLGGMGFLRRKEQVIIPWQEVRKIGFDVVLVESTGQSIPRYLLEEHLDDSSF